MSRYLVFTGVVTDAPEGPVQEINTLRYDLLLKHRNYRKEYFHATEDPEYVRTAVYRIIDSLASTLRVNSLVVQKQALYPAFQSLSAYYPILAGIVLHYFFNPRGLDARRYDDVLIFVDKEKEQRRGSKKMLKALKRRLESRGHSVSRIVAQGCGTHPLLQVADYCCYAVRARYEMNDDTYVRLLGTILPRPFEPFRKDWTV